MESSVPLIPKHGGYRRFKSFQVSQLVYDLTTRFCDKYIDRRSRTHHQMVQAARSGVQNIVEESQGTSTSKKFELKLTNVARAIPSRQADKGYWQASLRNIGNKKPADAKHQRADRILRSLKNPWRRPRMIGHPTFPELRLEYHRLSEAQLLCSEWEEVDH